MRHLQLARWLMPAVLLSALPLFGSAEVFNGAGLARHMMAASGEPQTQTDATGAAQPPATAKTPANRKHLNIRVGPVRMHIPVSEKRPVVANGNTATGTPDQVHPAQQPQGTPSQLQEPLANGNAPDSGGGPADVRIKGTNTGARNAGTAQALQTPAPGSNPQPAGSAMEGRPLVDNGIRVEANSTDPGNPHPSFDVIFRWTPVTPVPDGKVTYRLKVWQLMQGQSGAQAIISNQPIIIKDVDNMAELEVRNLPTAGCGQQTACGFVWNVQALDQGLWPYTGNNVPIAGFAFHYDAQREGSGPRQLVTEGIFDRWGDLYADSRTEQKTTAGADGQPGQNEIEASQLKQNPRYARAGENPAMGTNGNPQTRDDAIKANTPIIEQRGVDVRKPSGTPPIEGIKANQPIITKDVDELPAASHPANGVIVITTKKGVGGKPKQADQPVNVTTITLPANPDDAKRVNGNQTTQQPGVVRGNIFQDGGEATRMSQAGTDATGPDTCNGQTLAAGATCTMVTANPNGNAPQTFTISNTGGISTDSQDARQPKVQPPGQERGVINKGLPITNPNLVRREPNAVQDATARGPVNQLNAPGGLNQNGKAGPQQTVTASQGAQAPLQQNPQGRAVPGTANGNQGTPVVSPQDYRTVTTDKLQGPEGSAMQVSPPPTATAAPAAKPDPHAKPAKKKSKFSVHVAVF